MGGDLGRLAGLGTYGETQYVRATSIFYFFNLLGDVGLEPPADSSELTGARVQLILPRLPFRPLRLFKIAGRQAI